MKKFSWLIAIKKGLRAVIELGLAAGLSAVVERAADPTWLGDLGVPATYIPITLLGVRVFTNRLKQTTFWRKIPGVLAIVGLMIIPISANAQDLSPKAPTFLGVYTWQQAVWQYVDRGKEGYVAERGDFMGGRVVGGFGFGRLGVELRADIAGLEGEQVAEASETITTFETYGALHYILIEKDGFQFGPFVAVGSVSGRDAYGGGIGFDVWGAGVRFAGHGAEFHALVARHDYLPLEGWRLSISGHVPIRDPLYGIGDLVSGQDGYARVGMAVRLK